jgi:hypothetical protein
VITTFFDVPAETELGLGQEQNKAPPGPAGFDLALLEATTPATPTEETATDETVQEPEEDDDESEENLVLAPPPPNVPPPPFAPQIALDFARAPEPRAIDDALRRISLEPPKAPPEVDGEPRVEASAHAIHQDAAPEAVGDAPAVVAAPRKAPEAPPAVERAPRPDPSRKVADAPQTPTAGPLEPSAPATPTTTPEPKVPVRLEPKAPATPTAQATPARATPSVTRTGTGKAESVTTSVKDLAVGDKEPTLFEPTAPVVLPSPPTSAHSDTPAKATKSESAAAPVGTRVAPEVRAHADKRLDLHALRKGSRAEVDLGEAGKVRLHLERPDEVLDVRIGATSEKTGLAIERSAHELIAELRSSGVEARVRVSSETSGDAAFASTAGGEGHASKRERQEAQDERPAPTSPTPVRARTARVRFVL